MTELREVEKAAVKYWKNVGYYSNSDLAIKLLASRHHEEHLRIYAELEG